MKLRACITRRYLLVLISATVLITVTAATSLGQTEQAPTPTTVLKTAGLPVVVRVQLNGISVTGAHIVATSPDGVVAGSGDTDASGVWRTNLDSGDYIFTGTSGDKAGTAKAHVASSLTMVILELAPTAASPQ